ncbi:hypothetical protein SO802_015540 [Lithocarpus litseifolius]|uniref:RNase H type-1 domain-containing protein n=1 Tax=Lithocarpus litseifolius TaxID=425828 RepID=A0AAW2CV93_9ROSI
MKARILWLVEGDRNTAFYHTLALVRRRRNRILCMKDRVGNWLHGDREIADFIRKGFMELFTSDHCSASLADWNPPFWHSYLNEEEATSIDIVAIDEEITAGIWGLKPFKAPGSDGLHARFFQRFWLVVGESVKKESIPVCALLTERGMNISLICPMSNASPETISHALRDCPKAQSFWNFFSPPISTSNFYGTQILDWLRLNCRSMQQCDVADLDWAILFPIAIWVLWLHRNSTIFGMATIHKDLKAKTLAKAAEMAYLGIIEKHKQTKAKIQVRWLPPSLNWFKVNSDGSSMGNPSLAGGGGLIRNQDGEWVKGYARSIGCATSVASELWALRDGIRLCISLKLPAVVFELDAKLVVDLLKKDIENSNSIDVLVADCKEGLKEIPMVRIQHCYMEANKCADALASSLGSAHGPGLYYFLNPPSDVVILLSLDTAGTLYDRFVASGLEVF